jgi:hypothetical protein
LRFSIPVSQDHTKINKEKNELTTPTTKELDFQCKYCNHSWTEIYPVMAKPVTEKVCPNCKKIGDFLKEYNFFVSVQTGKK